MEIIPLTYNAIIIEYLLLAILIRNIPKNIANYICLGIIPLIIVFEVLTSISLGQETFIEYKNYNVYGQGETFQRISGCSLSRNSLHYNRIIRNRSYGTSVPDSVPGIVIYDIDLQKKDKFALPIRLQQQTPWNSQMYIGNQYVLEYNGKRSKVDMLFFHRGLHCLVAIDLKIGEFRPEYAGKMNYYLSLIDRLERREDENRSIGIILCAGKDRVEVELALEDMGKPIGVADYQLIVPQEELKKVVAEEMEAFGKELPLRTETEEGAKQE